MSMISRKQGGTCQACGLSPNLSHSITKIGEYIYGLHHRPTKSTRQRQHLHYGG